MGHFGKIRGNFLFWFLVTVLACQTTFELKLKRDYLLLPSFIIFQFSFFEMQGPYILDREREREREREVPLQIYPNWSNLKPGKKLELIKSVCWNSLFSADSSKTFLLCFKTTKCASKWMIKFVLNDVLNLFRKTKLSF